MSTILDFHDVKIIFILNKLRLHLNSITFETICWSRIKKHIEFIGLTKIVYWTKNKLKEGYLQAWYSDSQISFYNIYQFYGPRYSDDKLYYYIIYKNGNVVHYKSWHINGQYNTYSECNTVEQKNGLIISWSLDGKTINCDYWKNGVIVTKPN